MTPALYPAFFFVLEKAAKSAGNAVIPTLSLRHSHSPQRLLKHPLRYLYPTSINGYYTARNDLATNAYKCPRSLSRANVGTHSAFRERSHTRAYTPKQGRFGWGAITTLGAFRTFTNIPGSGIRTASFAAFGAWSGVLPKNAGSLGTAMRSCASLFRGVAAPLGCVICLQLGDVAVFSLCAQYFLNVRGGGGITTLGAFHTVRKPCVAGV